jgi:hypothetical protein
MNDLPTVLWYSFDMRGFFLSSSLLGLHSWYRSVNKRDWPAVCLSVCHTHSTNCFRFLIYM